MTNEQLVVYLRMFYANLTRAGDLLEKELENCDGLHERHSEWWYNDRDEKASEWQAKERPNECHQRSTGSFVALSELEEQLRLIEVSVRDLRKK